MKNMTPLQEQILLAVGLVNNFSLAGRSTINGIKAKLPVELKNKKDTTKILKKTLKN